MWVIINASLRSFFSSFVVESDGTYCTNCKELNPSLKCKKNRFRKALVDISLISCTLCDLRRGCACVIDWKTSSKPKPTLRDTYDYPLQMVAYIGALNQSDYLVERGVRRSKSKSFPICLPLIFNILLFRVSIHFN